MTNASIDFLSLNASSLPVKNFIFRDKNRPSYPGNIVVTTEDDKDIVLNASLRHAIKDYFTPARCRLCFDKLNILADIVLGDPHGIEDVDRINGETLIMVRTKQGKELFKTAEAEKAISIRPTQIKIAIEGQGIKNKKKEWQYYMAAWKSLGKRQLKENLPIEHPMPKNFPTKNIIELKHSLGLDLHKTRLELLKTAEKWMLIQKVKGQLLFPLKIILRIGKNLLKFRDHINGTDRN